MQLPFNNANVTAWRDDAKAVESADFDPEFLAIDRERRKKFFIERHERPKELTEWNKKPTIISFKALKHALHHWK